MKMSLAILFGGGAAPLPHLPYDLTRSTRLPAKDPQASFAPFARAHFASLVRVSFLSPFVPLVLLVPLVPVVSYLFPTAFAIQSPASFVPSVPPTSFVVCPASIAASTASSIRTASSRQPSVSSISAADRMAPIGFAMFLPACRGAEP